MEVLTGPTNNTRNDQNRIYQVFDCSQALEIILSYLTLSQQKNLIETSKVLAKSIRKSTAFQNRSKLLVCEGSYSNGVVQRCSAFEWKTLSVELEHLPLESQEWVKCLVRKAETLELHLVNVRSQEMINVSVTHLMTEILAYAHRLSTLKIDCGLMEKELRSVFMDVRVQIRLKNVQHLIFVNPVLASDSYSKLQKYEMLDNSVKNRTYKIQGTYGLWIRNLKHILSIRMNLLTLNVGKISASKENQMVALTDVVNNNRLSLNCLTVSSDMWTKGLSDLPFPLLKSLKLRAYQNDEDIIRKFLLAQPELECMDIGFVSGFPLSVLTNIQAYASRSKLKRLRLKCKYFVDSLDPISWKFLRELQRLSEFDLRIAPHISSDDNKSVLISPTDIVSIVCNLPKNIQKITVNGLRCKNVLENRHHSYITKFEYLVELNVLNCCEAVDDTLLQLLFSKICQLKSLKFSHCSRVTSFGLTGIKTDFTGSKSSTGYSLANLKNLHDYAMKYCPSARFEDLLTVLRSQHLRVLDICSARKVSSDLLIKMMKQNPSLEIVSMSMSKEDFNEVTLVMGSICHGIRKLIRVPDPTDWGAAVKYDSDSSDDNENEVIEKSDSGHSGADVADPSVASEKVLAAKKLAAKFGDLNFDEDVDVLDDLDRFDSEDEDFGGCDYIPG